MAMIKEDSTLILPIIDVFKRVFNIKKYNFQYYYLVKQLVCQDYLKFTPPRMP